MRQLTHRIREVHQVAGPAASLLFAVLALVLLSALAGATVYPGADGEPRVSESTIPSPLAPGQVFSVAIAVRGQPAQVEAYLPGLDLARVPLRFDAEQARYVGDLELPWFAPAHGRATLRVVADDHAFDLPLVLNALSSS